MALEYRRPLPGALNEYLDTFLRRSPGSGEPDNGVRLFIGRYHRGRREF